MSQTAWERFGLGDSPSFLGVETIDDVMERLSDSAKELYNAIADNLGLEWVNFAEKHPLVAARNKKAFEFTREELALLAEFAARYFAKYPKRRVLAIVLASVTSDWRTFLLRIYRNGDVKIAYFYNAERGYPNAVAINDILGVAKYA